MTPEESARVKELIEQINVEKDQQKFIELVRELNDLLDRNEKRLERKDGDVKRPPEKPGTEYTENATDYTAYD